MDVAIGGVAPDVGAVLAGKASGFGFDGVVVKDAIDGVGSPGGSEDHPILEQGIVGEVEKNAQVVEVAQEGVNVLGLGDVLGLADAVKVFAVDVVAIVLFNSLADINPAGGDGFADLG